MLSDKDIKKLMKGDEPIISPIYGEYRNVPLDNKKIDDYNSPIQPSSYDLHAGKIFIPDTPDGKKGSHGNGAKAHRIAPGESVIVSTMEFIALPDNIGAIVFPPSGQLSSKAILVSNIGHIDPGYKGNLRFTLINMGREPFDINGESKVGTILFFKTSTSVDSGWCARAKLDGKGLETSGGKPEPDKVEIDALAKGFADMDNRMEKIAKEHLNGNKYLLWAVGVPLIVTIILFLAGFLINSLLGVGQEQRLESAEIRKQNIELRNDLLNQKQDFIALKASFQEFKESVQKLPDNKIDYKKSAAPIQ